MNLFKNHVDINYMFKYLVRENEIELFVRKIDDTFLYLPHKRAEQASRRHSGTIITPILKDLYAINVHAACAPGNDRLSNSASVIEYGRIRFARALPCCKIQDV